MIRTKLARSLSTSSSKYAGVPLSRFDDRTINYDGMQANIDVVKSRLNRPLTLSEKVWLISITHFLRYQLPYSMRNFLKSGRNLLGKTIT